MTELAALSQRVQNLEDRINRHEKDQRKDLDTIHKKLDQISRDLAQRPPAWATACLSIATMIIGFLSAMAF